MGTGPVTRSEVAEVPEGSGASGGTSSIRFRLVIGCLSATAAAICVAGVLVYRVVDAKLKASGTVELRSILLSTSYRAAMEAARPDRLEDEANSFFNDAPGSYQWFVRLPGAEEARAKSDAFPVQGLPTIGPGPERETEPVIYVTHDASGEPYRVAGYSFTPALRERGGRRRGEAGRPLDEGPPGQGPPGGRLDDGGSGDGRVGPRRGPPPDRGAPPFPVGFGPNERIEVFVATSIADEEATLASLKRTLLGSGAAAIIVSCLGLLFVIRRSLAPLQELSRRVGRVDESTLDEPIVLPDAARELTPIVAALDSTRERLSSAFERERRFTADAAHELRTPLAGLRAVLEVVLRRERSLAEHRDAAEQCLGVTESMQGTVEALLALSRGEDATEAAVPIDVGVELARAFESVAGEMKARQLTLVLDIEPGDLPAASASPALLERIFSNLARNAADYATAGTVVTAIVGASEDGVLYATVSNECGELPDNTASAAFEPFWRADAARTGDGQHAGLGLALVAKAAEATGARVSIATPVSEGSQRFEVTVRFAD